MRIPPIFVGGSTAWNLSQSSESSLLLRKLGGEGRRGNTAVGIGDDLRDLVPAYLPVQPHADPAAKADIRRHEEPLRRHSLQRLLLPRRRGAPERQPAILVMIVH